MRPGACCPGSAPALGLPDLVPLLAWVLWRGRCRHCGAGIPPAIPLLEGTMIAVVILTAVSAWNDALAAATCLFGWLIVLLVVADLRHLILPDILTAGLLASGLLAALILPSIEPAAALFGAAIGGGSFLLLRFLYFRFRGIEGLGLGDVKLMAGLGAWFGAAWLPLLVLLAAVAGLTIVFLRAWSDATRISATSTVPFGAYLGAAALLIWCLKATGGWEW